MNICTISYGSSTAKWLAVATRSHPIQPSSFLKLRSKWELSRACQRRGLSSTNEETGQSDSLRAGAETPAESAARIASPGGDSPSVENGWSGKEEYAASNSQLSFKGNATAKPISNGSSVDSPENASTADGIPPFKRRPLPLSPLMDPAFLDARQKHQAPKLTPSKTRTAFQQQLAKNPFALALATPVRRCAISGTRLPSFFLQGFRVMSDPKTGDPWYVPASLANKHLRAKQIENLDQAEELEEMEELEESTRIKDLGKSEQLKETVKSQALEESEKLTAEGERPKPSKIGYQAYTLNRKLLLHSIVEQRGSKRPKRRQVEGIHVAKFLPPKYRIKSAMATYGKADWRQDMEDFVPMLMGRRISEALVHFCKMKRGYLVGCTDWEDALKKPQVAAFLWNGNQGDDEIEGPPEFATLDVGSQDFDAVGPQLDRKKRKIPVYNLQTLLGKEKLDELRQLVPKSVFEKEIVVLKHKNVTVELQSLLWKTQGYMAEHRDTQVTQAQDSMEETTGVFEEPSEPVEPLQ